jgi:hypothetical protein
LESGVADDVTKPKALAVGSLGLSAGNWAAALSMKSPAAGKSAPKTTAFRTSTRRVIFWSMVKLLVAEREKQK